MPEEKTDKLLFAEAGKKIRQWCAYQERCSGEASVKLRAMGLSRNEVDNMIQLLVDESYIDDRRFASAFARGKFHARKWGRLKIARELQLRQIPEVDIHYGLEQIDEEEYLSVLAKLLTSKIMSLRGNDTAVIRSKVLNFAQSRGFEWQFTEAILGQILTEK